MGQEMNPALSSTMKTSIRKSGVNPALSSTMKTDIRKSGVNAIILAGGKNTRMHGHDKAFLEIKGKAIAGILIEKFNGIVPDEIDVLLTLPGVGRKTANLVLTQGYGKLGICVDTHVHRISNLLGWVKTKTPEKTELELMKTVPQKYWKDINKLFVSVGRQYRSKRQLQEFLVKNKLMS